MTSDEVDRLARIDEDEDYSLLCLLVDLKAYPDMLRHGIQRHREGRHWERTLRFLAARLRVTAQRLIDLAAGELVDLAADPGPPHPPDRVR